MNAVVTTSNVKVIRSRHSDYAVGEIGYSYRANDTYYAEYFTKQFSDEQHAWTFVDSWKNQSVIVRYHPAKPQVSVLCESDQPIAVTQDLG